MAPTSLADLLEQETRRAPEVAFRHVRAILEALEAFHENGLVYGDLKPAHVLLMSGGKVRLVASDLSWLKAEASPSEGNRVVVGTPAYMAPEVFGGDRRTLASDIWCVGVLLYEMLMGSRPFPETDFYNLLRAVLEGEPEGLDSTLPPALTRFTLLCLKRNPSDRPATAGEALAEL